MLYKKKGFTPENILETGFFLFTCYSMTSLCFGIYIPLLAPGLLGFLTILSLFVRKWRVYGNLALILTIITAILYLSIQLLWHDRSFSDEYVKPFLIWLALTPVIDSLINKPGFLKHLAIFMFVIGAIMLPFMATEGLAFGGSGIVRLRGGVNTGFGSNSNSLAAWMGFCGLLFWLWSINHSLSWKKFFLWGLVVLSMIIVMKTVSRGALMGFFIAVLFSLRNIKRKQIPLLVILLFILFVMVAQMSVMSKYIGFYHARGTEDTGRMLVWPAAFKAFLQQPFLGNGADQVSIYIEKKFKYISPHNGFLFLGLASGIFPVITFMLMWFLSIKHSITGTIFKNSNVIDALPLITYAFIQIFLTNVSFMSLWSITAICYSLRELKVHRRANTKLLFRH